ncbi:condensation domain-containing protein [Pseudonocardia phyllosphaerae]|uniref:condensation domain-containing protein n=1 Tax=Pseudonocardia phyllosphaerae TaxID=3390502 RepID=UPI00397C1518
MLQQPLTDLDVSPGFVVEWSLGRDGAVGAPHPSSYNQHKHYAVTADTADEPDEGDPPFHSWIAMTFELPGPPDREALAAALHRVVARHEILRCDFERAAGDLTCGIIDADDIAVTAHEVGRLDTTEAVREHLFASFCTRLEIMRWPLLVMSTVEREWSTTVSVAVDHLVSDGGSVPILVRDLAETYTALTEGRDAELPPAGSYVEFGEQQRRAYDDVTPDDPRLAPWRGFMERNGGFFPRFPLDLGIADGVRLHPTSNRTEQLLDADDADALEAWGREHGVRVPAAVLGALGATVRALGGPETYRALLPVNERGRDPERVNSMGWYVNTMPVEFDVSAGTDAALTGANDALTEMVRSLDVPFVKAWYALAPELAALPAWPYAVNFFSFMDFRKAAGGSDPIVSAARMHVWSSGANGICHWFHRNTDGLHVNTIRVANPTADATERALVDGVRGVLAELATTARTAAAAR